MHALLAHLETADFSGAPRFLGTDRSVREVLSYIEVGLLLTRRGWYMMKYRADRRPHRTIAI